MKGFVNMEITGIMIYYYFVCKRKLWYFKNEITMEQNSELVELGKLLHEESYKNEKKSILINGTINIDFIDNKAILHEVKKTRAIEEASVWQLKYYIYYLYKNGIKNIIGELNFPLIKEKMTVKLTTEDENTLKESEKNIKKIITMEKPPKVLNLDICKNCAYYDLCYV